MRAQSNAKIGNWFNLFDKDGYYKPRDQMTPEERQRAREELRRQRPPGPPPPGARPGP